MHKASYFIIIAIQTMGMLKLPSTIMLGTVFLCGIIATRSESLRGKHLRIEGEYWEPYLLWECPGDLVPWDDDCPGNRTYIGVMYELLLFMQKARNFTFTLVHEADYEWGLCHSIDNCTGMIGMVNRGEVDLALGESFHFLRAR